MIQTPRVALSVLSDIVETAAEHLYQLRMVGIESQSSDDLEEALAHMPCLFCGVIGFSHDDDCVRDIFRDKRFFEEKRL